jgi:hypothetical protein
MRSLMRMAAASVLACLLGCAHGSVQALPPIPDEALAGPIGDVKITLSEALPESRRQAFLAHDGEALVRQAVVDAFARRSHWDPVSPQVLHLTVTVFRLRSTANAFINGWFAGIDMLEGEAEVTRGDAPPLRYTFKLSGSEDSYFKYSSGARFRSLARCLGAELAEYVVPVPSG